MHTQIITPIPRGPLTQRPPDPFRAPRRELLRAAALIFPVAGFTEKELRGVLGYSVRMQARSIVEELLASGVFVAQGSNRLRFAEVAVRSRFETHECPEFINLHRRRALALEAQFGHDLRGVVYDLVVHFLHGEAWQKANQAMSFALKNAMVDFEAIRSAARIVEFVVSRDFPEEVREHTLLVLRQCRDDTSMMLRTDSKEGEVSILQQVRSSERRDSLLCNATVIERVERHLRLIEDHYVYTLEEEYDAVDAATMLHFIDVFVWALQSTMPEVSVVRKGSGRSFRFPAALWVCGSNQVAPQAPEGNLSRRNVFD